MSSTYLEQRMIESSTSLSKDLARHLFARGKQGPVAIITDTPSNLHAALRKQWMILLRQVQRERSSTLQTARIQVLSRQIIWMQHTTFACGTTGKKQVDIRLLTLEEYATSAISYRTIYITNGTSPTSLGYGENLEAIVTYVLRASGQQGASNVPQT